MVNDIRAVFCCYGYVVQLVEQLAHNQTVTGSSPVVSIFAGLAQQGEHLPYKQDVRGSSPLVCIAGCGGHRQFS